jgi:hypothetical protein
MDRAVTLTDCVKEWLKINQALIDGHDIQFRGHSFTLVDVDGKDKYRIKFHTKVKLPKNDMGPSRMVIWRCTENGLGASLAFEININDASADLLDGKGRRGVIIDQVMAANPEFFDVFGGWLKAIIRE